jgi:hypothetical protein
MLKSDKERTNRPKKQLSDGEMYSTTHTYSDKWKVIPQ